MKRLTACVAVCLALAGCHLGNPSTGNDAEVALDPPQHAAPHRAAAEALTGVAIEDAQPQTMSQADLDSLGGIADRCVFRLTAVGWPAFVYDGKQPNGILKLNETLITLPRTGNLTFADRGLQVSLRPLGNPADNQARQAADLIIRLPHATQELGFEGYAQCRSQARLDGVRGPH